MSRDSTERERTMKLVKLSGSVIDLDEVQAIVEKQTALPEKDLDESDRDTVTVYLKSGLGLHFRAADAAVLRAWMKDAPGISWD